MKSKTCGRCKKRKAVSQFGIRSDNGKVRNTCKACINKQSKLNRNK